jgi:glycosyltransferase involved in cell wall biosynthesis
MMSFISRLIGGDKPRVIAVLAATREDLEIGVAHARTANSDLPIRSWCVEGESSARAIRRELRRVWPALTIVAWTGRRHHTALTLIPFTIPPFRILIFNEARGFFPAHLAPVANHLRRRLRDRVRTVATRLAGALHSFFFRSGERVRDAVHLVYSALLGILAFFAGCTPALVRAAMPAIDRPRVRAVEPAAGRTRAIVDISGRSWPRGPLLAALRKNVDFIVLTSSPNPDPERLIDAALSTNAFAVARQIAYSGWRPLVLNKHPFRKLQPGEVTRTFAPWSDVIVIRRDLLVSLGAPGAITTGAALMIVFWKAAAAGWKSFTLGHAEPVSQEPAMPLEDFEFVARLRLSGTLRALTPLRDEARGNIAFPPSLSKPLRGLPRVLVVSPYLPFPLSHGGAVRIYNLCRALSRQIDFILASFHEAGEEIRYPELQAVFREVYTVDIDEKHADSSVPRQIAEYRSSAMRALIQRLCSERNIDLIQLEYTQMAEYRDCVGHIPVLLVEHDITFTLYSQLANPEAALWRDFESKALRRVNAVWTMSRHDRATALEHGAPSESTAVIPNGVDVHRYQPRSRETYGPSVLFVGSFRHLPNLLAYEALRETIMPLVWREIPECRLTVIAGPDHERAARMAGKALSLAGDSRVTIHGFVEDVRPAYRECDVVVVPLPVSAGTNIKVIEAMACGRAVISTPVGCVGLELTDGEELLVRQIGEDFAKAVVTLLRNREVREKIARRARCAAEERFDWNVIAQTALRSIFSDARRPSRAVFASESLEWRKFGGSATRSRSASEVPL